ncbi:MAG: hypothetical protein JNL42_08040 [Anaerolineae bacterium]|nr:hypothetical protein [Anaerolineae bacterium]
MTRPSRSLLRFTCILLFTAILALAHSQTPAHAAAYVVSTLDDSGTGSLRQAIIDANASAADDTITFSVSGTITLLTALPSLANNGTLSIDGGELVTITRSSAIGTPKFRIFSVAAGASAALNGLTMTNGNSTGNGGGVLNEGILTVTSSMISGNTTSLAGGGILTSGALTIIGSTISGNSAVGVGGGLTVNPAGSATVINSTFSGNHSPQGGGAIWNYVTLTVINSTISGNTAGSRAGGIYHNSGTTTLQNTIIANSALMNCQRSSGTVNAQNTLIEDALTCVNGTNTDNLTGDPKLGSLANNGGSTLTFATQTDSPAINAGSNALVPAGTTTDQRGARRIVGASVDIGAYEQTCFMTFPFTVPASDTNSLLDAITCANSTASDETINLTDSTYTLTTAYAGSSGLPPIVNNGSLTINGGGATITRSAAGGTPDFRIMTVDVGATMLMTSLTISNGYANGGSGIRSSGTLTIQDSTIANNSSDFTSNTVGGIWNLGTLTLTRVVVDGNGGEVGGLRNNGTATIDYSTFSNNTAADGGGIGNFLFAALTLDNSTITDNAATNGGGIANWFSAVMTITNSTISGNSSVITGDLHNEDSGVLTVNNSTVNGGLSTFSATTNLNNTIVAGGLFPLGVSCFRSTGTVSAQSSLFELGGTTCVNGVSVGNVSGDPLLSPLADNGGTTLTHALLTGSPAIDAGSSALLPIGVITDQRGAFFPRIVSTSVDIGAVESCPTFPHTVPAGDSTDLIFSIACANLSPTDDVINLTPSAYTLNAVHNLDPVGPGASGLPQILPGTGMLTINGSGAAITRDGAAPDFRHFVIVSGASLTLNDLILTNGRADNGGAVVSGGTLVLNRVTVTGNTATGVSGGDNGDGGGLIALGGTVTITDSTFSGNAAQDDGGAIYNYLASTAITGSTLSDNAATSDNGGAINNVDSVLAVFNSTITANSAGASGGGVRNTGIGSLTLTHVTLSGNAAAQGGAVANTGGITHLKNSILADSGGCFRSAGIIHAQNSLIEDGLLCVNGTNTANVTGDPNLALLANNGGPTLTHALLAGSIAINAGDNSLIPVGVTTDQRGTGFPRILGGMVDMGAFETDYAELSVQLSLQGRPAAPNARWVTTVHFALYPTGELMPVYADDFISDSGGQFIVPNLTTGIYDIVVKGTHTLSRRTNGVVLNAGGNNISPAVLLEGDANDSNIINISDFSILAASFGLSQPHPNFNAGADFNQDGIVNIADFSLLASNFSQSGE